MAPEAAVAVFKPDLAAILAARSQVKSGIPHPADHPFFGLMTASEDAPDAGREARPFVLWRPEVLILQPARAGLADGRAAEVIPAAFIVGVAVYGAVNQRNEALAEDAFGVKLQHSRPPSYGLCSATASPTRRRRDACAPSCATRISPQISSRVKLSNASTLPIDARYSATGARASRIACTFSSCDGILINLLP